MSERYKGILFYTMENDQAIGLTCHFKFEKASVLQKYCPQPSGNRPICNGCGPAGYGAVVPDSILGVDIKICGDIHNWGYQFGLDREDKMVVDETFRDNMDRIIRADFEHETRVEQQKYFEAIRAIKSTNSLVRKIRSRWADYCHQRKTEYLKEMYESRLTIAGDIYAKAVMVFGGSSFWDKRPINFRLEDI